MMVGMNLTKLYCKHFVNVTMYNNNMLLKRIGKKNNNVYKQSCGQCFIQRRNPYTRNEHTPPHAEFSI
jgi:hypothetical protein